jgi:hypothetical protein
MQMGIGLGTSREHCFTGGNTEGAGPPVFWVYLQVCTALSLK